MAEVYFVDEVTEEHSLAGKRKKKNGIAKLKLAIRKSTAKYTNQNIIIKRNKEILTQYRVS